jgi:hypothetical protein
MCRNAVAQEGTKSKPNAFCTTLTVIASEMTFLFAQTINLLVSEKRKISTHCTAFLSTVKSPTCAEDRCNLCFWVKNSMQKTVTTCVTTVATDSSPYKKTEQRKRIKLLDSSNQSRVTKPISPAR